MAGEEEKGGFWRSLPGVITAVSGLIVAVGGLLTVLVTNDIWPSSSEPTPTATDGRPEPTPTLTDHDEWPPYPGVATVGDTGRTALAWQEILIQCGALSDISANHDAIYGSATGEKVQQLESHWGWQDADTTADRLTYNRIIEFGCN